MLRVQHDTGESLIVVNPIENTATRWHAAADSAWEAPSGAFMSLVPGSDARRLAMSSKNAGPVMLERVSGLSAPTVTIASALVSGVTLLVVLLAELWAWLTHRHQMSPRTRILTVLLTATQLAFIVAFSFGLYQLAIKYDDRFAFGIPAWFSMTLAVPYASVAVTIVLGIALVRPPAAHRWRGWLAVAASSTLLIVLRSWRVM
jgi:hypothetical protein